MLAKTNGNHTELPEDRKAAVKYGLEQFQVMAAERDTLRQENLALKEALHLSKITCEAQATQINEEKSKAETALLKRDEAMAMCVQWETLYTQLNATMRAFKVPNTPLIKDAENAAQ